MPEQITIHAERRGVLGKAVRRLRRQGVLPANIFGGHKPSVAIQLNAHEVITLMQRHGPTALYHLMIAPDGQEDTALVRHVQRDPVSGAVQHIDFQHVALDESIRARIALRFEGEAPAARLLNGVLLHSQEAIEVEAHPGDLPSHLVVDVSHMDELSSVITVGEVALPPGVRLLSDPAETVAMISMPRAVAAKAEEPAAAASAPASAEAAAKESQQ